VKIEPAPRCFLEGKSEGIELLLGAEPDKTALAHVDARIEMALVPGSRGRIHAIGTDHEVVFPGVVVRILELGLELEAHPEFACAGLEDLQQLQAPYAAEAMATGHHPPALEEHVDVVPMMEVALDFRDHLGIVLAKAVHGLVGKHDAPAEGAVGLVAFDHGYVAGRIGLLHQDRKVQASGASAQTHNTHRNLLVWRHYLDLFYFRSKVFCLSSEVEPPPPARTDALHRAPPDPDFHRIQ
jgi:hypothetical protein